jgi:hypothetical protein
MIENIFLGPVATDLGWVSAPRYLMRRARILRQVCECYSFQLTNVGRRPNAKVYAKRAHRNYGQGDDRKRDKDRSGTDRGPHLKLYPLLFSLPGKLALRTFCDIQLCFIETELGSSDLVKASRA